MAELPGKGKCKGRERLIKTAEKLAQARPFDEITIDEIVKGAALSRPAFYYHFVGGKEELREELVRSGTISATPASDTHQAILNAALRVFARAGIMAATLDDIATEAGISRSALSWHFHSKEDLLLAIIEQKDFHAQIRVAMEQITRKIEDGSLHDDEEILRQIAGAFYDFFTAQSDLARLSVLLAHSHPDVAHLIAEKITRGRRGINDYIKKRQEEGNFRQDIDAALFVQVLAMTFVMRAVGREGLNDLLPFAHLSRDETINQLVSLLLYGIKKTA
ncbi:MAG: TetR family transcriptional regulator [Ktedonobacteraceae bacterium]|nr:TetR family transcriptional regulator [Ktedonobacteraceae bacterium]